MFFCLLAFFLGEGSPFPPSDWLLFCLEGTLDEPELFFEGATDWLVEAFFAGFWFLDWFYAAELF